MRQGNVFRSVHLTKTIRLDYKIVISVYQVEFNSHIVTLTQDGDMRRKLVGWCRRSVSATCMKEINVKGTGTRTKWKVTKGQDMDVCVKKCTATGH